MGVLAFKIVLKIYYKSFSKHLTVEETARSFKAELKTRFKVESEIKSFFNLFILFIMGSTDLPQLCTIEKNNA